MRLPGWLLTGLIAVIALAVGAWALVAFVGDDSPGPAEDVTVEALIEEPDRFQGIDAVRVSGEVQQVGQRVFTIGAQLDDGQVLVVPPDDGTLPGSGEVVRVTGEVRRVRPPGTAVAEDTVAVDSPLVEQVGGGFGIIARSVEPLEGAG